MKDEINYPKMEKMLIEYVYSLPEGSKSAFFEKYRHSQSYSFYAMLDNYFYSLGMISSNIDFINQSQCHPYVKFQIDNRWSINKGLISLSEQTVTFSKAQELLANYLINLLKLTPIN